MRSRHLLYAVLTAIATAATSPSPLSAQYMSRAGIPATARDDGPELATRLACDGRAVSSLATRRAAGGGIALLGAVAIVWSVAGTRTVQTQFGPTVEQTVNIPLLALGVAGMAYGGWTYMGGSGDHGTWDKAVNSLTVGQSRISDARECLGDPVSTTQSSVTGSTVLTYENKTMNERRVYTLTFTRGVLSNIERSAESKRG